MNPPLGKISLFPYEFVPAGWKECDGTLLTVGENIALFNMLRDTYGGDDMNTFAVPDLRSVAPKNCKYCIYLQGDFPELRYEGCVGETYFSATDPSERNVKECAGQQVAKAQFPKLAQFVGTKFGGDAANIKLPDLRSKTSPNPKYVMVLDGFEPGFIGVRPTLVGELILMPYDSPQDRLIRCLEGVYLPKQQATALFSLLGTRFGDGGAGFAVPNLTAAAPKQFNYYMAAEGVFPSRG